MIKSPQIHLNPHRYPPSSSEEMGNRQEMREEKGLDKVERNYRQEGNGLCDPAKRRRHEGHRVRVYVPRDRRHEREHRKDSGRNAH